MVGKSRFIEVERVSRILVKFFVAANKTKSYSVKPDRSDDVESEPLVVP